MAGEIGSLRKSFLWGMIAFCVVLAAVVGVRLEKAALTVVVGVVCGVGASIPTSLLIVLLLHKRSENRVRQRPPTVQPPQVVVVTPPTAPQIQQPGSWPNQYTLPVPTQRQFSVIGEEDADELN